MSYRTKDTIRKGLGAACGGRAARASRRCSISICSWCTRSLLRRRLKACGWPGARCAARTARIATVDHNVPTTIEGRLHIVDQIAATQIATLRKNCAEFGVELYDVEFAASRASCT